MGQSRGISSGRIRGVTATPFQAIVQATIALDLDSLVASGGTGNLARVTFPLDPLESYLQSIEAMVASGGIPVDPPKAWFEKRTFTEITPLTITADGQVFGHVATFGACHISFRRCEPVPRSQTNYATFRTGTVLTAEGTEVRTGPLMMDTVHPDLRRQASDAQAFYAHTGSAMADVIPYEDQFGIAIVGAIRPGVKPEQLRALRGSDVSPDWRTVNGRPRECVALLAVNNSGFKVPQALAASAGAYVDPGKIAAAVDATDEVFALVASGPMIPEDEIDCDDTPVEMAVDDDRRAEAIARIQDRFGAKFRTFTCASEKAVRSFGAPGTGPARRDPKETTMATFTLATPPPARRTFGVATEEFHGQGPGSPEHGGGGKTAAPKQGGKVTPKGLSSHLMGDWEGKGRSSLSEEFQYEHPKGQVDVTVRATVDKNEDIGPVRMSGGVWEAQIVAKGVTLTSGEVNTDTATSGRKEASGWIEKNLNGLLDSDDPKNYEALALADRRTFGVATEEFHAQHFRSRSGRTFGVASEEFHAQHDQKSHGNRGGGSSDSKPSFKAPSPKKPKGGGVYSTDVTADGQNYSGHPVPTGYLQNSTRLTGPLWKMTEFDGDPDRYRTGGEMDGIEPDVMLVTTQSGRQRAFIKPTGKIVKPNRTRPSLYEYDMFKVDTVGRARSDRKTSAMGVPGEFVQKLYANSETVELKRPLT
jgi:hypothetical protein